MTSGHPSESSADPARQVESDSPQNADTPRVAAAEGSQGDVNPEASSQPTDETGAAESAVSGSAEAGESSSPATRFLGKGPLASVTQKPASPAVEQPQPTKQKPAQSGKTGQGPAKPASPQVKPQSPQAQAPAKPSSPAATSPSAVAAESHDAAREPSDEQQGDVEATQEKTPAPGKQEKKGAKPAGAPSSAPVKTKAAVPSLRQPLSGDLQAELEREMAAAAELDSFLAGSAGMAARKEELQDGARVHATVLKIHDDGVFVSLGGPDEGVVPLEQFTEAEPQPGDSIEVIVRGISSADGLYQLTLPGGAIDVSDWSDIEAGSVVEATVTGANSGGLECTVAGISGFIPISQISEHRVEDTAEFVGQKFLCVVTEANPRRGNLVVSRRAVLEREREEKRQQQLEQIDVGDLLEGTVRTVKDFGAFVDLGGLEGLIHISKMSWDRIKHPSEVLEEGQKVKVKIDKIDKQTGKISLSYRDLLENPWDQVEQTFPAGTVTRGTVTRTAAFGAFVRLAAGIEGLVHISEIAGHRVSNVASFVQEGQEVDVKVLSVDRDTQKISLSMKQAHHQASEEKPSEAEDEAIEVRDVAVKPSHAGPLRGGKDRPSGGERFGLRW